MKIPSREDMERIEIQNAEKLKILKEGGREELESRKYIPPGRRRLLELLLQEEELTGIREWYPSEKTLRRLRELPFMDDTTLFIKEEPSPFKKYILREVERYLEEGDILRLTDIIKVFEPSIEGKESLFLRRGDVWIIKFKGNWTVLNDNERLRYIIHLLDNPYKQFHVLDLMEAVKANNLDNVGNAYNPITGESRAVEGMNASLYDIGLSEDDIDRYKRIINDLASKLKAAETGGNGEEKSNAQVEWNNLKKYLSKEYGLCVWLSKDYTPRYKKFERLKPEVEKVRQIVKNQINKGYRHIAKSFPVLSDYLKKHISQGVNCIYTPNSINPIKWDIRW